MPGQNEFADYIAKLYHERKQDSLFFIGIQSHIDLLEHLQPLLPDMFRTDCPIIAPMEYSNSVQLRLDNNFVFYESGEEEGYKLVEKFSVSGGPAIVLELGTWNKSNGVRLEKKINRWDRRYDLMGAKFVNTLWEDADGGVWATFIRNSNDTIIGSAGKSQDQLFYMTERLNLTIETRDETMIIGGEVTEIYCFNLLLRQFTDVCSGGVTSTYGNIDTTILITSQAANTLLAGVKTESGIDTWAFVQVFGWAEWIVIFSTMIVIVSVSFFEFMLDRSHQRASLKQALIMPLLFLIQQGSHPQDGHLAKRILSLSMSIVTMVIWIYYANDITAKLTSGPPPHPVRTFDDVVLQGYKVIVTGHLWVDLLKQAKNDSAKYTVYKKYFEEDFKKVERYWYLTDYGKYNEAEGIELPNWFDGGETEYDAAEQEIIEDKKTLWYCDRNCISVEHIQEGKVIDLQMDDIIYTQAGYELRSDSEFLSVFSHYRLKAFETGIFKRIDQYWTEKAGRNPTIDIGIAEPQPLRMSNVMFLFSFVGAGIVISIIIAAVEHLVRKSMNDSPRKQEVTLLSILQKCNLQTVC